MAEKNSGSTPTPNTKPKSGRVTLTTKDGTPITPLRQIVLDTNEYAKQMPTTLMPRPGFSTAGKPAQVSINSHKVLNFPTKMIYQYDVSF